MRAFTTRSVSLPIVEVLRSIANRRVSAGSARTSGTVKRTVSRPRIAISRGARALSANTYAAMSVAKTADRSSPFASIDAALGATTRPVPRISGRSTLSLPCTITVALAGARRLTRTYSSRFAHIPRTGDTELLSTRSFPVRANGVRTGSRTFTVRRTVSAARATTTSYRSAPAGGFGSHARNAPLGATGTDCPLMTSDASPVPTLPSTKLESRLVSSWLSAG